MSTADIVHALGLPVGSRVDQRIPKSLLVDNGAPTSADKRLINEGVERLQWHAAIKPTTSGVPEYRDEARHYVEIAVLELILRPAAKMDRLVELTHRAVPYPVVLVTDSAGTTSLSMVHKRWSQGEADRVVLDGDLVTAQPYLTDDIATTTTAFLDAMAIGHQPQASLHALYQGWIDTVLALQAAARTGTFQVASSDELASARRDALRECATIEAEMSSLRAAAKTKQLARRADINLELQRLKSRHAAAQTQL